MMRGILTIVFIFISTLALARTIIVGKNQPVNTLRKAVELAKDGDTILVQQGVYFEGNIIISKNIILLGQNFPVLDGENKNEILTVSGRDIVIRGFVFQNSGRSALNDLASIKIIDAGNIVIENNHIVNAYFGIHVSNSSKIFIRHNIITGTPGTEQSTGNGIHLWKCEYAVIDNNRIRKHRDGIYFEFVTDSEIKNNISENNIRYGLHFMFSHNDTYINNTFRNNGAGVAVMYSKNVRMEKNHFEQNWGSSAYGILLKDISDSHIRFNHFYKNTTGIHMEGSSRIEITKNIFKENGWAIRVQASCDDNNFYNNNFLGNSFDVATNGTLVLNRFYNNYWDKYEGYDRNRDGTGDIPHHPVSMYSMIVEQNPYALILLRSFIVSLLDKAEKVIPSLTPIDLMDEKPLMKPNKL